MSCSGSGGSASCTSIGNVFVVTGSVTNFAATTDVTIDTGGGLATVNVLRVKVKWTAGTATTFTPRLYNLAAAASGSINMQFEERHRGGDSLRRGGQRLCVPDGHGGAVLPRARSERRL